jgi:hypothetical protein
MTRPPQRASPCPLLAQTGDSAAFGFRIKKLKFSGPKNRPFLSDPLPAACFAFNFSEHVLGSTFLKLERMRRKPLLVLTQRLHR